MGIADLRRLPRILLAGLALAGPAAHAGSIDLQWDPVANATGYKVYYGTRAGQYTLTKDAGNQTTVTVGNLTDCTNYYMAVKAYNGYGESDAYSNEVFGWARPALTGSAPTVMQGKQLTVDLYGQNFQPGLRVSVDNPNVRLSSATAMSCSHLQLLAAVEPMASGVRPAEIGSFKVMVENPDTVIGSKSNAFTVAINPFRFDVNRSDSSTRDRVDGKDTVWISRSFGSREGDGTYVPDQDLNGDGWIDGDDLAYVASNLGRCWSGTAWGTCSGR